MEKKESIDFGRLMHIMSNRKEVLGGIVAGCTVVALGMSFMMPKQYESTTLVQMRSGGIDLSGAAAMAASVGISLDGGNSSASPVSYIELMKSRRVIEPIIDEIYGEGASERPDVVSFAKSKISIENKRQTNLITITAKGRTPEEAQLISQSVVDNFLKMQTENSQQTQSFLVSFLNERINNAKNESDDAANKLALFQREHQIYSPSEQAKLMIDQLNAYDKAISEMQVQEKSAQAQYDVATQKLGEQKAGAFDYNINDNSTVQSIRAQIVAKEVELVGLRQKYTDRHPNVVVVQNQVNQLHNSLSNEVRAVVNSNAASLNTAQMELLKNQVVAQAEASAASASEVAIKEKKVEKEKQAGQLPDTMMNYLRLESDAKIKQEIYTSLVQ